MAKSEAYWIAWARANINTPSKEVNTKLFEAVMNRVFAWDKKSEGGSGGGGRGGKGLTGFDITDLMGDGSGNAAPARTIQDNIGDAMRAAGQVSSAPSARGASDASGSDMHGQGSSSPTSVTIEAGAIVVSGVSDPMAAAEEAIRLLSQRIGRLTRAPGAGRSL